MFRLQSYEMFLDCKPEPPVILRINFSGRGIIVFNVLFVGENSTETLFYTLLQAHFEVLGGAGTSFEMALFIPNVCKTILLRTCFWPMCSSSGSCETAHSAARNGLFEPPEQAVLQCRTACLARPGYGCGLAMCVLSVFFVAASCVGSGVRSRHIRLPWPCWRGMFPRPCRRARSL